MNTDEPIQQNSLIRLEEDTGMVALTLIGDFTIENASEFNSDFNLEKSLDKYYGDSIEQKVIERKLAIDLSKITSYDSYLVLIISKINDYCNKNNIVADFNGATPEMQRFLTVLMPREAEAASLAGRHSFFENYITNVGVQAIILYGDTLAFVEFTGDMIKKLLNFTMHPGDIRWKDFPYHYMRAGVNAALLVCLILFLIGMITGYQSAVELKPYGADNFIANIIGISITRELAPLMTAILVAGRSGSAFAAELGTMKVTEEIAALNSLGFDIMKFLVLPRVFAVTLAMPVLTALADVTGIAGGCISAMMTLNITLTGFINELNDALTYLYVFSGIGKSIIFGFLVASVGCFRGLQVSGGAESVGRYTTLAVVSGVFLIILSDAVFTIIFQAMGF